MKIGFTGTREGLSARQAENLRDLIEWLKPTEVHHGGCIGADHGFHEIVLACTAAHIYVHPGLVADRLRVKYTSSARVTVIFPAKPPLVRNRAIMDCGMDTSIACPGGMTEEQRSGTWSTIRYVKKANDGRLVILFPDGSHDGLLRLCAELEHAPVTIPRRWCGCGDELKPHETEMCWRCED